MTGDASSEPVVILVVDDDVQLLAAAQRLLSAGATKVLTAVSGLHAMRILEARRVDILISDEVMPGMDGVRLLEAARERWPDARRMLFTGHPWPDTVIEAVNRGGVHHVLVKPLDPERMLEAVFTLVSDVLTRRRERTGDSDPATPA